MSVNIDGKHWPLDRFMRGKIIINGGADLDKTKLSRMENQVGAMQWLQENEVATYKALIESKSKQEEERVARCNQAEIRLKLFSRRLI